VGEVKSDGDAVKDGERVLSDFLVYRFAYSAVRHFAPKTIGFKLEHGKGEGVQSSPFLIQEFESFRLESEAICGSL
jgi:hypothetical protein